MGLGDLLKQRALPRLKAGDRAPDGELAGPDGQFIRLASLWSAGPAVLVFLRHFGWPFCRRALARLAGQRQQYGTYNATAVAISMGTPESAAAFCGTRAPGVLCLSDPERIMYRAFGLGAGGMLEMANPAIGIELVRAAQEGFLGGIPEGDVLQMPGVFVIGADGILRLAYYSRHAADHPDDAIIEGALKTE